METIGKVNRYICKECRAAHGTVNLNTGITPFMIPCQSGGCTSTAQSSMYELPAGENSAGWCWYRPNPLHFMQLGMAEQRHVLRGGLLLGDFSEILGCSSYLVETEEGTELLQGDDVDRFITYMVGNYLVAYQEPAGLTAGKGKKNYDQLFAILLELKQRVDEPDVDESAQLKRR